MHRPTALIAFYLLAFGWSWGLWWPAVLFETGSWSVPPWLPPVLATGQLAAWGPLFAALLVTLWVSGRTGLVALLRRMIKARFGWRLWIVSIFLLPGLLGLIWGVLWALGQPASTSEVFAQPIAIPISFLWILVLGGPLQEEAGWRGIGQEGLQRAFPGLTAALAVGMLWGLWHLPLFSLPSAGICYDRPFWGLFLSTVFLSVIIGWLYNKTGGSLLAAMVIHASFNWANYLFPVLETDLGGQLYFAALIGICLILLAKDKAALGR